MDYIIFFLDNDESIQVALPIDPQIGDTIIINSKGFVVESREINLTNGGLLSSKAVVVTLYVSDVEVMSTQAEAEE